MANVNLGSLPVCAVILPHEGGHLLWGSPGVEVRVSILEGCGVTLQCDQVPEQVQQRVRLILHHLQTTARLSFVHTKRKRMRKQYFGTTWPRGPVYFVAVLFNEIAKIFVTDLSNMDLCITGFPLFISSNFLIFPWLFPDFLRFFPDSFLAFTKTF